MLVSCVSPRPEAVTKDVQPLKASFPILVSEAGKAISVRAEQPLKAEFPMLVSCVSPRPEAATKDVQPLKAEFPMLVSEAGKAISVRAEQP